MGVEIIFPIAWLVSLVAIILLTVRSRKASARPYTLPTLIGSGLIALLWAALDHKHGYFWQYALTWFAPSVIVLGSQAHSIRWLLGRRGASAAP